MNFNSLVIEGAGMNGFAYLGAVKELEEQNLYHIIHHFAGTSSGALIATMLALGYSSSELLNKILQVNIAEISNTSHYKQIYNLYKYWGIHNTVMLRSKISRLISEKVSDDITFKELYDSTGNVLVIVLSDVQTQKPIYTTPFSHPNHSILDALVVSLSVPFYFTPTKYDDHYCVDGGLADNFPLWIFNNENLLKEINYQGLHDISIPPETLGLKIRELYVQPINSVFLFIFAIFRTMINQIEETSFSKNINVIDGLDVSFQFDLGNDVIQKLVENGQRAMRKFLKERKRE